jgi:hypothetical protein
VTVPRRRLAMAGAMLILLLAVLGLAVNVALHRRAEEGSGLNVRGYRGPVLKQKGPREIRVAVLGGSVPFGSAFKRSLPLYLEQDLNNPRLRGDAHYEGAAPMIVADLTSPCDGVGTLIATMRDYATLNADIFCLYVGHEDRCVLGPAQSWRGQSWIFRTVGYWWPVHVADGGAHPLAPAPAPAAYLHDLDAAIEHALRAGRSVLVVTHPFLTPEEAGLQDRVGPALRARFRASSRFSYVDLRTGIDTDPAFVARDGVHLTPDGNALIAENVAQAVFHLVKGL